MLLWTLSVAWAACPEEPVRAALERAAAMEEAWTRVDERAFDAAHAALDEAVACFDRPATVDEALAIHRAKGLGSFVDGELTAARRSYGAVRTIEPDAMLDLPEGHPLRKAFDDAFLGGELLELERVPSGGWVVDGTAAPAIPSERAFVLQGLDAAGAVVHSGYHFTVAEVPQIDFEALDPTVRQRRRTRMHVLGTALAGVLASGATTTWTLAAGQERTALAPETADVDRRGHADLANALSHTTLGLYAGAAVVGTATWVIKW